MSVLILTSVEKLYLASFKAFCYKKELDTTQGRTLGNSTFGSPTSFKAFNFTICVDALKHRLELSNGEQFTIVMLNPVSFTNTFALRRRFCLELRASVPVLSLPSMAKTKPCEF
ncbi:hypothetical protein HMPREF9554_02593 [Treponema phagedenis F0421]|nr:hypothetical protein HMPREF9554_02593 [Treponema phagedenis F0421]